MSAKVKPGDRMPDFSLPSQDGTVVSSSDLIGKKALVLFFYPRDHSPICTKESCSFRDHYESFLKAGAEVIGISSDPVASHAAFAADHRLPYRILSDADGAVRKRFGISSTLGLLPGRMTFVVDQHGTVRHTFNSQLRPLAHVRSALEVIEQMKLHATEREKEF